MKIHKETIASELQLFIDGVNSKEQVVEEIAAYIRWRDKQLTIPVVVGQSEQLICKKTDRLGQCLTCGDTDCCDDFCNG